MRTIVALNGQKFQFEFKKDDVIICCDGAYEHLKSIGVVPTVILGDFDSLGYVPEGAKVFPVEKDFTDGELAVTEALKYPDNEVVIIYAGGLREDHFLGNLSLLLLAREKNLNARIETEYSSIFYTEGDFTAFAGEGKTVSVVPLRETLVFGSDGLKYAYRETKLLPSSTLGLSNVAVKDYFRLEITYGAVFVIINKKQL